MANFIDRLRDVFTGSAEKPQKAAPSQRSQESASKETPYKILHWERIEDPITDVEHALVFINQLLSDYEPKAQALKERLQTFLRNAQIEIDMSDRNGPVRKVLLSLRFSHLDLVALNQIRADYYQFMQKHHAEAAMHPQSKTETAPPAPTSKPQIYIHPVHTAQHGRPPLHGPPLPKRVQKPVVPPPAPTLLHRAQTPAPSASKAAPAHPRNPKHATFRRGPPEFVAARSDTHPGDNGTRKHTKPKIMIPKRK